MPNINEIKDTYNVQTHINKAYEFLDEYLPQTYRKRTQLFLKSKGINVSSSTINNVRNQSNQRLDVINALVAIAKEEKAQVEELIQLIN